MPRRKRTISDCILNSMLITIIVFIMNIYLCLYSLSVGPWLLLQFLNPIHSRYDPWTGDQPVIRPIPTHGTTQTQNKPIQLSMPWVGFEPTIPAFKRVKTVHVFDRVATVMGHYEYNNYNSRALPLIWKPDVATELTQSTASSHLIPNISSTIYDNVVGLVLTLARNG
jgi:hypothetical protein